MWMRQEFCTLCDEFVSENISLAMRTHCSLGLSANYVLATPHCKRLVRPMINSTALNFGSFEFWLLHSDLVSNTQVSVESSIHFLLDWHKL